MIDSSAFIAPGVAILGDVTLGPESSVWYNAGASRRHGPDCDRREDQHSRPDHGAHGRGRAVHHRAPSGCGSLGGSARLPDADDCLIGIGSIVLNGYESGPDRLPRQVRWLLSTSRFRPPRWGLVCRPAWCVKGTPNYASGCSPRGSTTSSWPPGIGPVRSRGTRRRKLYICDVETDSSWERRTLDPLAPVIEAATLIPRAVTPDESSTPPLRYVFCRPDSLLTEQELS